VSEFPKLAQSDQNTGHARLEDETTSNVKDESQRQITLSEADDYHEHEESTFDPLPLPEKRYTRWWRNLRWTFFNVYERLVSFVLLANVVMMIYEVTRPDRFLSPVRLSTPVAVNIAVTVMIRNEHVVTFLFWLFGKTPKSLPLRFRRFVAKLYHLGGIHSGCGIAAVLWFFLYNTSIMNIQSNLQYNDFRTASFFITVILDLLFINILILSLPQLRARYHNMWEQLHRFAGWAAIGLFWIQTLIFVSVQDRLDDEHNYGDILVVSPNFYLLIVTTLVILSPWFKLRKVPVRAEPLSDHAVRLHFTHENLPICTTPRFSDSTMKEWHAFAAIPAADGAGYSVLVSKAGDWTAKIIKDPPRELWTKGTPARGALYMGVVFRKIVVVATGSGIAPILSLLHAPDLDVRVLWSTPGPAEKVFAPYIVDYVKQKDPQAVIIDTRATGRPNLVEEAWKIYSSSGAEAVFIISNAAVTRKFVYGLESRGVPTFAPIFDS